MCMGGKGGGAAQSRGWGRKRKGVQWVKQWSVWVQCVSRVKQRWALFKRTMHIIQHYDNSIVLNIIYNIHQDWVRSSTLTRWNKTSVKQNRAILPHTGHFTYTDRSRDYIWRT